MTENEFVDIEINPWSTSFDTEKCHKAQFELSYKVVGKMANKIQQN